MTSYRAFFLSPFPIGGKGGGVLEMTFWVTDGCKTTSDYVTPQMEELKLTLPLTRAVRLTD